MSASLIKSSRTGSLLTLDNKLYYINSTKGGASYWRCKYKHTGCKATAKTVDGVVVSHSANHCCGDHSLEIMKRRVVLKMKERVVEAGSGSIQKCYDYVKDSELLNATTEDDRDKIAAYLPGFGSIQASLHRTKAKTYTDRPKIRRKPKDVQFNPIIIENYPKTTDSIHIPEAILKLSAVESEVVDSSVIDGNPSFIISVCEPSELIRPSTSEEISSTDTNKIPSKRKLEDSSEETEFPPRDEHQLFGDYVADTLRNLKTEVLRKQLRNKILANIMWTMKQNFSSK